VVTVTTGGKLVVVIATTLKKLGCGDGHHRGQISDDDRHYFFLNWVMVTITTGDKLVVVTATTFFKIGF
jgi:hypothetical protein